jgi:dsRNA-specific ribonuclease
VVEVRLKAGTGAQGKPLARGKGSTKKLAEQDAARRALDRLRTGKRKTGAAAANEDGEENSAE